MSVLIKGMEMPGSCYYCPFADGSWGYSPPHKKRCLISGKDMPVDERYVQKNQPVCPLVPVPPHGRLIDADAFKKYITVSFEEVAPELEGGYKWLAERITNDLLKDIDDAPTVIEAEEGE